MPQFLVAIHHPDGYEPFSEDVSVIRAIDALNDAMDKAGVVAFVGGLHPAPRAKSIRLQRDGSTELTDGPYIEAKEHIGGFWVLDVKDMDEAVAWGRKASVACNTPVEVRQFFSAEDVAEMERAKGMIPAA